jgi:hypothetical protein
MPYKEPPHSYLRGGGKQAQNKWDEDIQTLDEEFGEGSDPWEEGLEEDEPVFEADIFLESTGTLGGKTSVSAEGKHLGDFSDDVEAIEFVKLWMEENKYWPNVWMVSDHGNIHGPIDVNAGKKEAQRDKTAEDFEEYLNGCVILDGEGTIDKNSTEPIAVGIIHDGSGFNPGAAIFADYSNKSEDVAVQAADDILLEYKLKNESEHMDDDLETEQEKWSSMAWTLPSNIVADIISKDEQASLHISIIEEDGI